jgi:Gram-negative bacterial TonB protein C-terminal
MKVSVFISIIGICLFRTTPLIGRSENRPPQYFSSKEWKKTCKDTIKADTSPIYTIVEENPTFVGGNKEMYKWLSNNIKYPPEAREHGDEGAMYVGFVIEIDGSISNVKMKSARYRDRRGCCNADSTIDVKHHTKGLEIESVRVIAAMPPWIPGKVKGKPVRTAYTLPVKYWLE